MLTVLFIVIAMLAFKGLLDDQRNITYRCFKCGASRPDMHHRSCEDRLDRK